MPNSIGTTAIVVTASVPLPAHRGGIRKRGVRIPPLSNSLRSAPTLASAACKPHLARPSATLGHPAALWQQVKHKASKVPPHMFLPLYIDFEPFPAVLQPFHFAVFVAFWLWHSFMAHLILTVFFLRTAVFSASPLALSMRSRPLI